MMRVSAILDDHELFLFQRPASGERRAEKTNKPRSPIVENEFFVRQASYRSCVVRKHPTLGFL